MAFLVSGFIFGFLIPYMARRFSKFMPATMAYGLYRLIWPVRRVSKEKRNKNGKYKKLAEQYFMRSLGWAIVTAALSYCVYSCLNSGFYLALIWMLLLLYEIDERMLLLPDIITVPVLILGFLQASLLPVSGADLVSPALASAIGAAVGYVLPVVATLFMVKKHPDAFGGGDIKLLSGVGAWLGFEAVPLVILLSSIIFGFYCLAKRARAGAFGPAIVIATIVLVFFLKV